MKYSEHKEGIFKRNSGIIWAEKEIWSSAVNETTNFPTPLIDTNQHLRKKLISPLYKNPS